MKPKKEELDEFEDIIFSAEGYGDRKVVNIVSDGKQLSVRIPQKFVDTLQIDPKKNKFEFVLEVPPVKDEKPVELKGRLIHD